MLLLVLTEFVGYLKESLNLLFIDFVKRMYVNAANFVQEFLDQSRWCIFQRATSCVHA